MGRNFVSICHLCKVIQPYFRSEECIPMHQFYAKHAACMQADANCVATLDDQEQETLIPDYTELRLEPFRSYSQTLRGWWLG